MLSKGGLWVVPISNCIGKLYGHRGESHARLIFKKKRVKPNSGKLVPKEIPGRLEGRSDDIGNVVCAEGYAVVAAPIWEFRVVEFGQG